jgi:hypothetical protein
MHAEENRRWQARRDVARSTAMVSLGALKEAGRSALAVLLEVGDETYRVETQNAIEGWSAPDPEKVTEVLDQVIGSWADLDIDAEIEEVYRARHEGSRPWNRR